MSTALKVWETFFACNNCIGWLFQFTEVKVDEVTPDWAILSLTNWVSSTVNQYSDELVQTLIETKLWKTKEESAEKYLKGLEEQCERTRIALNFYKK